MTPSPAPAAAPAPDATPAARPGLAWAAVGLGLLAIVTSVAYAGGFFGLAGLVFGGIHLGFRRDARRMAWTGIGLSVAGIVVTLGFGAFQLLRLQSATPIEPGSAEVNQAEWIGRPAPDFAVRTLEGDVWRLSEFRGRRVIVDCWATWCPPCLEEIPHFMELRRAATTNDLAILGLSREDRSILKPFVTARRLNYPVAGAGDAPVPDPFGSVTAFPTTFVIDRQGRIESVLVGYRGLAELRRAAGIDTPEPAGVDRH